MKPAASELDSQFVISSIKVWYVGGPKYNLSVYKAVLWFYGAIRP